MSPPDKSLHASTWVWILSVIVIVCLGTLAFPVTGCGPTDSGRPRAKNDATQIAHAIEGYVSEYGELPVRGAGNVNTAELMNKLAGAVGDAPKNSRKIVFLEVPRAKKNKNGAEADDDGTYTSGYKDPWGNEYEIRIDVDNAVPSEDYDGKLEGPDGTVKRLVIVWSRGNPQKRDSYENKTKWIKSWD
jgi:hypothetical protein